MWVRDSGCAGKKITAEMRAGQKFSLDHSWCASLDLGIQGKTVYNVTRYSFDLQKKKGKTTQNKDEHASKFIYCVSEWKWALHGVSKWKWECVSIHKQKGQTRMKIPAWNLGGNDTYFYSIFLVCSVWRFSILKYRRSFIFSKRSKEIDLFQA